MSGRCRISALAALLLCALPVLASAQQAPATPPSQVRHPWIVAGGTWTTLLGDCTNCDIDTYLHTGGVLGNAGVSLNPRTDLGAEIFWVPETLTTGDQIRVTFVMAAVQFRPWRTRGFFLKTGAGMAFLRNWLDAVDTGEPPVRSKAFALAIGGGWEWTLKGRLGAQAFATQHAAALGDLQTSDQTIENVMGNFWSVGAALVIR
jgi:hypothetical protein